MAGTAGGGAGGAATPMVRPTWAVAPVASVTRTTIGYPPAGAKKGQPSMVPHDPSESPAGSDPPASDHE